jgi:hypothetical protein
VQGAVSPSFGAPLVTIDPVQAVQSPRTWRRLTTNFVRDRELALLLDANQIEMRLRRHRCEIALTLRGILADELAYEFRDLFCHRPDGSAQRT